MNNVFINLLIQLSTLPLFLMALSFGWNYFYPAIYFAINLLLFPIVIQTPIRLISKLLYRISQVSFVREAVRLTTEVWSKAALNISQMWFTSNVFIAKHYSFIMLTIFKLTHTASLIGFFFMIRVYLRHLDDVAAYNKMKTDAESKKPIEKDEEIIKNDIPDDLTDIKPPLSETPLDTETIIFIVACTLAAAAFLADTLFRIFS